MNRKHLKTVFHSFRFNIIVLYSVLLLISLTAVGAATSALFSRTLYQQSVARINSAAKQMENSMGIYFDDVANYVKAFLADDQLYEDVKNYGSLTGARKNAAWDEIRSQISRIMKGNDNISDVFILNDTIGLRHKSDSQDIAVNYGNALFQTVKRKFLDTNAFSISFLVAERSSYIYSGGKERHLLVCFPLRDYRKPQDKPLAVAIFEYRLSRAEDMYRVFADDNSCRSFLLDADNNIIFGTLKDNESLVQESGKPEIVQSSGKHTALTEIDLPRTGWHLCYAIRPEIIHAQILPQQTIIFIILIITICLSVFISILIGNHISHPVNALTRQMEQLADGNMKTRINPPPGSYTELNLLFSGFNNMAEQIEALMDDVYKASTLQHQAELASIRSKINPHFFYNALQTISSFALLGDCDGVERATRLLGQQFEYVVYDESETVEIDRELRHISGYLEYQNIRRKNPVKLTVAIPENVRKYYIPKLIIQPMIENAMKYAFPGNTSGTIEITGEEAGNSIILDVRDNGAGIAPERLEQIRAELHDVKINAHLGLTSIHSRLRLRWGNPFGISIQSTSGAGTEIRLIIPRISANPEEAEIENQNTDR